MKDDSNVNWLCRYCEFYAGMEPGGKATRCADPQFMAYFEPAKDYFLHYSPGRPSWCHTKPAFSEPNERDDDYASDI